MQKQRLDYGKCHLVKERNIKSYIITFYRWWFYDHMMFKCQVITESNLWSGSEISKDDQGTTLSKFKFSSLYWEKLGLHYGNRIES